MNEITLLREAAPDAPPLTYAARSGARAALLTEIGSSTTDRRALRVRRPRRRTAVRLGLALAAAASAWTTAVVIAAPDELGPLPSSVRLVAFEPPVFPLALDPAPPGLTPRFSADPGGVLHAGYGATGTDDAVGVTVTPEEPDLYGVTAVHDVSVRGADAELVVETHVFCDRDGEHCRDVPSTSLVWQQGGDRWVRISGEGRYDDPGRLLDLAAHLVERPQAVPLQVHLAPVGWSVLAYKEDRILTLVNDAHEQQTLNVFVPEEPIPADRLLGELMGPVGPVIEVTVHGRPAQLVQIDLGPVDSGWYLQAQFPDGTTFVVQAPKAFTRAQVLAFAEDVTYTP